MLKKILIGLLAAAIIAVPFSGTAFAAEDDPGNMRVRGEVIAVDSESGKFRIESMDGEILTFFTYEDTRFIGKAQSLDELEVGWKVGVGAKEEDDQLRAVLVISGNPEEFLKVRGKVTDVNNSAGKFSIEKPDGEEMTFFVNEKTRYGGQISKLEDLQEGWHAAVIAKEENPGKLLAVGVVGGNAPELVKVKGTVTAVDVGLGKFEIKADDGKHLRFFVDEKTRYQGQLSSLDEMQVGWTAAVAAKEDDGGNPLAVLVIAGTRPDAVRAQGVIVGVNPTEGSFHLEKQDGTVQTFYVNSETAYRGQISGLIDLEEGMRAGVGGYVGDDGLLVAKIVVAGYLPDERPEITKAQGEIKTVNPGADKFQLKKPDGSVLTVFVDENTKYRGQVSDFADLEKGMRAGFGGYINQDGQIIARVVIAGNMPSDRPERPDRPQSDFPGREWLNPESDLPSGEITGGENL